MDEAARYNQQRWRALAQANALFTRPQANLDEEQARERIDPRGRYGDLKGKSVLCLASGGGQQSVAFGLLGANVTVVDLSEEQIERDQQMAQHYGLEIAAHQGDMRDLSRFAAESFEIVFHPYSINFVPDATVVFEQIKRILKRGGLYDFMCANPFAAGLHERSWNGEGYTIKEPYLQGQRIQYEDEEWVYDRTLDVTVPPPVEYRHTLSTLINGLVSRGFVIKAIDEIQAYEASIEAAPGTWDHFTAVLPPWFSISTVYQPDILKS
jgi:ubiquinone/menaquinone biosynthesis C-methylase UbiE